jgi:hypothetical protein
MGRLPAVSPAATVEREPHRHDFSLSIGFMRGGLKAGCPRTGMEEPVDEKSVVRSDVLRPRLPSSAR